MTKQHEASAAADEPDEQVLLLLERYERALANGDTWDLAALAELNETQRRAWDAATLALRAFLGGNTPLGEKAPRQSTTYLPSRIGRYEIDRMVGAGGFSIVYLGCDSYTNRQAAIKIPRPHVLLSPELRDRFVREAQAAAKLEHPHIISIYEAGIEGELPYIAYAYCEGPTLAAWAKETAELLSPRAAAELMLALAQAVAYSHSRGIVHRDITPGNVLLNPLEQRKGELPFEPKLCDFGLAKLIESDISETASNALMGTPAYMAPEQAERGNRTIGALVDVYGLGALFYLVLTGRAPFVRDTPWEVLAALRETEPIAPQLLRPGLPRDLETICLKCLEKEPASRYASAAALACDLERFLDGKPVHARPASIVRRAWQWGRRHPSLATAILSVLVAACTLFAGLVLYSVRVRGFSDQLSAQNDRLLTTISERDAALTAQTRLQQLSETRAEDLRHALYTTDIERAADAWRRGDMRVMRSILEPYRRVTDAEPDLREFAWRYLWRHNGRELFRLKTPKPQYSAKISPDGRWAAFAGADSVVRLVSIDELKLLKEIPTGQKEINDVIFGPQNAWLATAGDDGTVGIYNLPDGMHRAVWPVFEKGAAFQLAYREPENLLLVCGQSPDVMLLDCSTGEKRGALTGGHQGMIEALTLSPDQCLLITCGDDRSAVLWDLETKQFREKLTTFEGFATCAAWSPDGRRAAIGAKDHRLAIYEIDRVQPLGLVTLIDRVSSVAITRDGWILAGDGGGGVSALRDPQVFDIPPELVKVERRWSLDRLAVMGLATSPSSPMVATSSRDGDIALSEINLQAPFQQRILAEGSTNGGDRVVAGPDRRGRYYRISRESIRIFVSDAADKPERTLDGEFGDMFWHEDKLYAISMSGQLARWNTSGEEVQLEYQETLPQHAIRAEWIDDNRMLIWFHPDSVGLWNLSERRLTHHWPDHHHIAVTPDRSLLALARNQDFGIRMFDGVTLEEQWVASGHTQVVRAMRFGPGGRRLYSGGDDREIRVWDMASRRLILKLPGHEAAIAGLAVSPDEKTLVVADKDGNLRLWDLRTGRELFELATKTNDLRRLDFSDDGLELIGIDGAKIEYRWSCQGWNDRAEQ